MLSQVRKFHSQTQNSRVFTVYRVPRPSTLNTSPQYHFNLYYAEILLETSLRDSCQKYTSHFSMMKGYNITLFLEVCVENSSVAAELLTSEMMFCTIKLLKKITPKT
jgi:hypothetical protein